MTLSEFVTKYGIEMRSVREQGDGSNWACEFRFDGQAPGQEPDVFTCTFPAWPWPPTTTQVLSWLAGDARTVLAVHSFEEWAEDLDVNPDSRREERRYQDVRKRSSQLKRWLGSRAFRNLLDATDE